MTASPIIFMIEPHFGALSHREAQMEFKCLRPHGRFNDRLVPGPGGPSTLERQHIDARCVR